MGSRGSFIYINLNNFAFKEGGQTYFTVGSIGDIIMIIDKINAPVTAPEYSHSKERIYVINQKNKIKHVAFYDENHIQIRSIDFSHFHKGKNHMYIMEYSTMILQKI